MYSVRVSKCLCLCVSTYMRACADVSAFIHVLSVTLSPVQTMNTGRSAVRLTRACVGCHLLSPPSQIKKYWGGHRNSWGEEGMTLAFSPLRIMSERERREERETQCCCIRFVKACLVQLVRHIWIAQFRGLPVVSTEEAVWAYKRQARRLEFASRMPLSFIYTICTHKNIGTICYLGW